MSSWIELISYISFLILVMVIGLFIPFFADDVYRQFKAKKIAKEIAEAKNYSKYDIQLLDILLRAERIDSKYLKFLIGKTIRYIHEDKSTNEDKLIFFKNMYESYNADEIYNDISQPLLSQMKALKLMLNDSEQTVLMNLAHNIKLIENKAGFSKKLNLALTGISILVTIGSLIYSYWHG